MKELMTMSEKEMVAVWRQMMNLDVPRSDCRVERADGVDLDGLLLTNVRLWYEHLLLTAPPEQLPVADVSAEAVAEADSSGVVTLTLPARCVRLLEVQMQGWQCSATRLLNPDNAEALLQSSPWLRGGGECPVAVRHADRVMLYSIAPGAEPVVQRALAVVRPGSGLVVIGRDALSSIPRFDDLVR
ncbi:MAG: hypothetical protein ACI30L_05695 [Muribaculaceae bacterium]